MKTITLGKLKARLDSILRMVAEGEEIQIVDKRKPVARLVPPDPEQPDWSDTFKRLDEVWRRKSLPGKAGSDIVVEGRR